MILYEVFPNKTLKILEDENTYITENLISSVHIKLPSTFGDYPVKELTAELRFYFPEGDYMAYTVDTQQARPEVPITNDITEKPQTLSVMLFFYKGETVIGKTNSVDKVIYDAPLKGEPLTPRAEFDEVIAEQRETIAEQANTITEQTETITTQGEQITELSGEVDALTVENEQQAQTIARQNTTIDQLNSRVPPLEVLEPINPSQTQRTYTPESPNIGFPQVVVNAPTAEGLNFDYADLKQGVEFLGGVGTYAPTYGTTKGGIYITEERNEFPKSIVFRNWKSSTISQFLAAPSNTYVEKIRFENCPDVLTFKSDSFTNFSNLSEIVFPENLKTLIGNAFSGAGDGISTLVIPDSVDTFNSPQNMFSNTRFKKIILPQIATCIHEDLAYKFVAGDIIEEINIPHGFTSLRSQMISFATSLKKISLPNTITNASATWCDNSHDFEEIILEDGFNCSIVLNFSTKLTPKTIVACLEALADRTGQAAYTITFGTTNLNKLTAEQKAIATNKNWNLA